MDDTAAAVTVNLKLSLVHDSEKRPKPLKHSERMETVLPSHNNLLQFYLNDIEKFTVENKMKINISKTKVMKFQRATNFAFPLEVNLDSNEPLEQIQSTKLLGVMITEDLKWASNTEYICRKAKGKYTY